MDALLTLVVFRDAEGRALLTCVPCAYCSHEQQPCPAEHVCGPMAAMAPAEYTWGSVHGAWRMVTTAPTEHTWVHVWYRLAMVGHSL